MLKLRIVKLKQINKISERAYILDRPGAKLLNLVSVVLIEELVYIKLEMS